MDGGGSSNIRFILDQRAHTSYFVFFITSGANPASLKMSSESAFEVIYLASVLLFYLRLIEEGEWILKFTKKRGGHYIPARQTLGPKRRPFIKSRPFIK